MKMISPRARRPRLFFEDEHRGEDDFHRSTQHCWGARREAGKKMRLNCVAAEVTRRKPADPPPRVGGYGKGFQGVF